jgi:diacylglycerol kinase
MKRQLLVYGSIFAVFLLISLPLVPAAELNIAVETNKLKIIERIRNMDVDELEKTMKDVSIESTSLLVTIVVILMIITLLYRTIKAIIGILTGNQPPATPEKPSPG